jgi:hypothetical protein
LSADAYRLREELEHRYAKRLARAPNPLGSGQ